MTIDEAIKKCNEEATRQESIANSAKHLDVSHESIVHCKRCATEHRQLAEWLMELKDLREENKVLTRDCLRLIKSNDKLRKKLKQIAEYKRLLKVAVNDMNSNNFCHRFDSCKVCSKKYNISCDKKFQWCYTDRFEKLIGDESSGV